MDQNTKPAEHETPGEPSDSGAASPEDHWHWFLELTSFAEKGRDRLRAQRRRWAELETRGRPLLLAFRYAALSLDPEELAKIERRASPALAFALRHVERRPFGIVQLVIECERHMAMGGRLGALAPGESALELLGRLPEPRETATAAVGHLGELKALALGYRADALRIAGRLTEAEKLLSQAKALLGERSGETRATLHQVEALLLRDRLLWKQAQDQLEQAEKARGGSILMPGRREELKLYRGRLHLARGESALARQHFTEAASGFPAQLAWHLQFEAWLGKADTHLSRAEYPEASEALRKARPFLAHCTDLARARRLWLIGMIALRTERFGEAWPTLTDAFYRFVDLRRLDDASRTLDDLTWILDLQGESGPSRSQLVTCYRSLAEAWDQESDGRLALRALALALDQLKFRVPRMKRFIREQTEGGTPAVH
ncbi:MAG: hypothetical protein AAF725_14790 [Acidobacteriota bacterium]